VLRFPYYPTQQQYPKSSKQLAKVKYLTKLLSQRRGITAEQQYMLFMNKVDTTVLYSILIVCKLKSSVAKNFQHPCPDIKDPKSYYKSILLTLVTVHPFLCYPE